MKTTTEVHKQALNSLITIGKEQGYLTDNCQLRLHSQTLSEGLVKNNQLVQFSLTRSNINLSKTLN